MFSWREQYQSDWNSPFKISFNMMNKETADDHNDSPIDIITSQL